MGAKEELREGIDCIHKGEFQRAESILSKIISKKEDYNSVMEAYIFRGMSVALNYKPNLNDSTKQQLFKYVMQDMQYILDNDSDTGRKTRANEVIAMVKDVFGYK